MYLCQCFKIPALKRFFDVSLVLILKSCGFYGLGGEKTVNVGQFNEK